jgi:ketosteroid isomerase-like protein
MPSNLDLARDFYAALARADADRLRKLLHPQFTGHVTDGTPSGLGGTYVGPKAMLRHVGGPVDRPFTARPAPERFLSCESGEGVVTGRYIGQPPGAGRPLTAAFAHVLAFRDGQLAELRQFTNGHRWQQAAAAGLGTVRRMFEAAERRDPHALLSTYADDIVITEAASLPYGGVYHGHHGAVRHARAYTPPGTTCKTPATAGRSRSSGPAGDRVVVLWRQKATAADGRHLDLPVADVIELRNGKVGSLHMFPADTAKLLEFLRAGGPQAQPG